MGRKMVLILCVTILLPVVFPTVVSAEHIPGSPESAIVFVIDVSGSMNDNDPRQFARDALRLGVDLAPDHSSVGIVTVSNRVVSELPLTDVSTREGRQSSKAFIDSIYTDGNTDFLVGLQRAVEMLQASPAEQKRLIFLGDFQEGGFNLSTSADDQAEDIIALSVQAREQGILIDMLLIEEAPETSITATQFLAMPGITGGSLFTLDSPGGFCSAVEDIYFQNYTYFDSVYTLRGVESQTIQISMPTNHVQRARIYVSASNPVESFGATYAGAALDGDTTDFYAIIDLEQPARDGVTITVTPGETALAHVYLFLEYDIELAVSVEHNAELREGAEQYTQITTVTASIVDAQTRDPIVEQSQLDQLNYTVSVFAPGGQAVQSDADAPASVVLELYDAEDFGRFGVAAELSVGPWVLSLDSVEFDVEDTRPEAQSVVWPIYLACAIGAVIVLAALIYARHQKKQQVVYRAKATKASQDYKFSGLLKVFPTIVQGGALDVRPFEFSLKAVHPQRRVTLGEIFDAGVGGVQFKEIDRIIFLVGPDDSLTIKNDSNAVVRISGQDYIKGQKVALYYDEKMNVIIKPDEDEIQINYRRDKQALRDDSTVTRMHFNSVRQTR